MPLFIFRDVIVDKEALILLWIVTVGVQPRVDCKMMTKDSPIIFANFEISVYLFKHLPQDLANVYANK